MRIFFRILHVVISSLRLENHAKMLSRTSRAMFSKCRMVNNSAFSSRMASKASQKEQSKKPLKRALAVGASIGLGYALMSQLQKSVKSKSVGTENIEEDFLLKQRPPEFNVARRIRNTADTTGLRLTLYQYQTCPFCCKARAFLDYFGLNYDVIEVNSVLRTQVKWSTYKKVPILVAELPDGRCLQLNDSSMIISAMFSFLKNRNSPSSSVTDLLEIVSFYPRIRYRDDQGKEKTDVTNKYFLMLGTIKNLINDRNSLGDQVFNREKVEDLVKEREWRQWVDTDLVHKLSPNVYRTPSEALAAFQWFDKAGDWPSHFSVWERYLVIYVGAAAMWIIGKRLKRKYGLEQDVRESLYSDCRIWTAAVKRRGGKFHGGDRPDLADLAVFGCLGSIAGCEAFADAIANTDIGEWYSRMKDAVSKREGQDILHQVDK